MAEGRLPVAVEDEIVGNGELGDEPGAHAVLGDVGDARLVDLARIAAELLAADPDRPGIHVAHPGDRLDELALAVALDAGDGEDLARVDGEAEVIDRRVAALVADGQVRDLEHGLAGRGHVAVHDELHRAADHHGGELFFVRLSRRRRADHLAAAQDRDAIGDLQHLVELVGDEDHRGAEVLQRADHPEQLVGLLRGQDRGRLVEDEEVRLAIQRLDDLDPLTHADR